MHHFAYWQMVAHCVGNVFIKQGGLHAHGLGHALQTRIDATQAVAMRRRKSVLAKPASQ